MDRPAAARTRRRILDYARREGLVMAGMHLPPPALLPSRCSPPRGRAHQKRPLFADIKIGVLLRPVKESIITIQVT